MLDERNTWTWVDRVFDPDQLAREYVRDGDEVFFVDPESGRKYQILKHFEEGFEDLPSGVAGLRAMISEQRKWTLPFSKMILNSVEVGISAFVWNQAYDVVRRRCDRYTNTT